MQVAATWSLPPLSCTVAIVLTTYTSLWNTCQSIASAVCEHSDYRHTIVDGVSRTHQRVVARPLCFTLHRQVAPLQTHVHTAPTRHTSVNAMLSDQNTVL
jgi:hypothetical protein